MTWCAQGFMCGNEPHENQMKKSVSAHKSDISFPCYITGLFVPISRNLWISFLTHTGPWIVKTRVILLKCYSFYIMSYISYIFYVQLVCTSFIKSMINNIGLYSIIINKKACLPKWKHNKFQQVKKYYKIKYSINCNVQHQPPCTFIDFIIAPQMIIYDKGLFFCILI